MRFQLQLSCENLVTPLAIGQPKPQITVFYDGVSIGKTEIASGLSPVFNDTIPFSYKFGTRQKLTFSCRNTIWHIIKRPDEKINFGSYSIEFEKILQEGPKGIKLKLRQPPSKEQRKQGVKYVYGGKLKVFAFMDNRNMSRFTMQMAVTGLKGSTFSTPNTFLEITQPSHTQCLYFYFC